MLVGGLQKVVTCLSLIDISRQTLNFGFFVRATDRQNRFMGFMPILVCLFYVPQVRYIFAKLNIFDSSHTHFFG